MPSFDKIKIQKLAENLGFLVVRSADEADICLIFTSDYIGIAEGLKVLRSVKEKPFCIYNESDWPFAFANGMSPSITKRLQNNCSWSFLRDYPRISEFSKGHSYLYSWLGRTETHKVRSQLLSLDTAETPIVDLRNANQRIESFDYHETYWSMMNESIFVLCPRGFGASSIRIFEAMSQKKVPVIIGDDWIEPPVGEWNTFSIRIPESDISQIPSILKERQTEQPAMAEKALAVFQANFTPEKTVKRMVEIAKAKPTWARTIYNAARAASPREIRTMIPASMRLNRKKG